MKPLPRAAKFLIAVTVLVATPYVALGVRDALDGLVSPEYLGLLFLSAFVLSVRPIRVQTNTELSASDVAVRARRLPRAPGGVARTGPGGPLARPPFAVEPP